MSETEQEGVLIATPAASPMIESLRGLSYSTASALADLIDNSLSAGADKVDLVFHWDDRSQCIYIKDNGHGMDHEELFKAMRLGFLNPLTKRHESDLGRFGFGLKTSSFSQCRCLTVASRSKNKSISVLRWDLDYLANAKDQNWYILTSPGPEAKNHISKLAAEPYGTLIVWEKLDRIITPGSKPQDFLDLIDNVEFHLGLIFHRFLQTSNPLMQITINGKNIRARDPFMSEHPASWHSPPDNTNNWGIRVMKGHVLPHPDRMTEDQLFDVAGMDGLTSSQGFYIYRNKRLLVHGSWLHLGRGRKAWTKEEAFKLARIQVDITNQADSDWKLDIRKSRASPPAPARDRLERLASSVRDRARRVFAYRSGAVKTVKSSSETQLIWNVKNNQDGVKYQINRSHPIISDILKGNPELSKALMSLITLIEVTVPVQRIWLEVAEGHQVSPQDQSNINSESIKELLLIAFENRLNRTSMTPAEVKSILKCVEPFNHYPELVDELPETAVQEQEYAK